MLFKSKHATCFEDKRKFTAFFDRGTIDPKVRLLRLFVPRNDPRAVIANTFTSFSVNSVKQSSIYAIKTKNGYFQQTATDESVKTALHLWCFFSEFDTILL